MMPRCSSRRTRWCTAETDRPTRSARSVKLHLPSAVSAATMARSVSSMCEDATEATGSPRPPPTIRQCGGSAHQRPGDDQPLYLVGPLHDLQHLRLPHPAFHGVVLDVSGAAEHLHRVGGDPHR